LMRLVTVYVLAARVEMLTYLKTVVKHGNA